MNKALFVFGVWLILVGIVAGSLGNPDTFKFWRLARHGVQGAGVVTERLATSRTQVRYRYAVSNETYFGQARPQVPNPTAANLTVGDPLVVYFEPDHPASSVLANPATLFKREVMTVGVVAVLFPTFILIFGYKNRLKKRRRG